MILAPVVPVDGTFVDSSVTVRLIGTLDRLLVESFADACAGLTAPGGRTLVVLMRDLAVMRDENLDRLLAILVAYREAGHRVFIDGSAAWRKVSGARGAAFPASDRNSARAARRQIIICHSVDKRVVA